MRGLRHLFHGPVQRHIEGLTEAAGSTGSNPLNVVLNVIPSNIVTAFGSNGAVLSSVFLAVAVGLSMNVLGESRTATLRRLLGEVNDVVVVFLNFVVTNFAPFAVFVLLTRTFAIYGIDYLKPALVYVVVTVVLLFVFLLVAYPLVVALGAKQNPITFIKKIANVAVFGFSTSSSAATLPLNIRVCTEDFGVDESIASFVLPLGMTINMDGTASCRWWPPSSSQAAPVTPLLPPSWSWSLCWLCWPRWVRLPPPAQEPSSSSPSCPARAS